MSAEPIIYGAIFIGVLILVEGIYLVYFGRSIDQSSRVNRRLQMLNEGNQRTEVYEQLSKEMDQHKAAQKIPLFSIIADKARKAAVAFSPRQLATIMVGLAVIAFVGLTIGTETSFVVRIVAAAGVSVGAVYFWLSSKAAKRVKLFQEQLPDAIELMIRSLKVGHPFSSALQMAAKESQDPLGTEFGFVSDECAYGRDVGEALKELAERMNMQDLRFLAVAVSIQQQSGGNLAEILAGLVGVIRVRFRLFRRVTAITAEAKWSGKFLSSMPILILIGISIFDPDYFAEVEDHALFMPAAIGVGALLAANLLVMRFLTNIKI